MLFFSYFDIVSPFIFEIPGSKHKLTHKTVSKFLFNMYYIISIMNICNYLIWTDLCIFYTILHMYIFKFDTVSSKVFTFNLHLKECFWSFQMWQCDIINLLCIEIWGWKGRESWEFKDWRHLVVNTKALTFQYCILWRLLLL